jgi:hypothetical protein
MKASGKADSASSPPAMTSPLRRGSRSLKFRVGAGASATGASAGSPPMIRLMTTMPGRIDQRNTSPMSLPPLISANASSGPMTAPAWSMAR